jgi:hypothetical protein
MHPKRRSRNMRPADSITLTFTGEDAEVVRLAGRDNILYYCRRRRDFAGVTTHCVTTSSNMNVTLDT